MPLEQGRGELSLPAVGQQWCSSAGVGTLETHPAAPALGLGDPQPCSPAASGTEGHRGGEMLCCEGPAQRRPVLMSYPGSGRDLPSAIPARGKWLPAALGTDWDIGLQTPASPG